MNLDEDQRKRNILVFLYLAQFLPLILSRSISLVMIEFSGFIQKLSN